MEASKRAFLTAVTSLVILFTPLILCGCNPLSQDLVEATPTLNGSPTKGSTQSGFDQSGILDQIFFDIDHTLNGVLGLHF